MPEMPLVPSGTCTCNVAAPVRHSATIKDPFSNYAVRLSYVQDDTVFDPACPFHGVGGSMVVDAVHHTTHPEEA